MDSSGRPGLPEVDHRSIAAFSSNRTKTTSIMAALSPSAVRDIPPLGPPPGGGCTRLQLSLPEKTIMDLS